MRRGTAPECAHDDHPQTTRRPPDDIDALVLRCLIRDPEATNSAIAQTTGLSHSTVRARGENPEVLETDGVERTDTGLVMRELLGHRGDQLIDGTPATMSRRPPNSH